MSLTSTWSPPVSGILQCVVVVGCQDSGKDAEMCETNANERGRDHVITSTYLRVFVQGVVRSKRTLPTCERTICRDEDGSSGDSNGQAGRKYAAQRG